MGFAVRRQRRWVGLCAYSGDSGERLLALIDNVLDLARLETESEPGERLPVPLAELLRDSVHDRLRDAIVDGTLAPGEVVRDTELATWLGWEGVRAEEAAEIAVDTLGPRDALIVLDHGLQATGPLLAAALRGRAGRGLDRGPGGISWVIKMGEQTSYGPFTSLADELAVPRFPQIGLSAS